MRERLETEHQHVPMYIFSGIAASKQYEAWGKRYSDLAQKAIAFKTGKSPEALRNHRLAKESGLLPIEREEMAQLLEKMRKYKQDQRAGMKSILKISANEHQIGAGKDNIVYASNKEHSHAVEKYSIASFVPTPETIEYLQKKYAMLRRFLGKWIPKSAFVLGERRTTFDQKKAANAQPDNYLSVITIQRRIQGATFQTMDPNEKLEGSVMKDLQEAHKYYVALKHLVVAKCLECGLPENTLDVKLDIGHLSKEENLDEFDPKKVRFFTSPNIMYDKKRKGIFFIDFDMNNWNKDKEQVFQKVMAVDPATLLSYFDNSNTGDSH